MKFIKKGELPETKVFEGNCNNCKSVLEATKGELTTVTDCRNDIYFSADCLLCNNKVQFFEKESFRKY